MKDRKKRIPSAASGLPRSQCPADVQYIHGMILLEISVYVIAIDNATDTLGNDGDIETQGAWPVIDQR